MVSGVGTSICLHILSLSHDRGCPATYTTLKKYFWLGIFFGIFQTYTHKYVALVYNSLLVLIFFPSQATYMSLQLCRHSFWFMFCIMPFMPGRGLILQLHVPEKKCVKFFEGFFFCKILWFMFCIMPLMPDRGLILQLHVPYTQPEEKHRKSAKLP